MSPIIANIYMHNVLMLRYKIVFSKEIKEDSFLVAYAQDSSTNGKLKDTKNWLYKNRTMPVKEMIKALNLKLVGHYRYLSMVR